MLSLIYMSLLSSSNLELEGCYLENILSSQNCQDSKTKLIGSFIGLDFMSPGEGQAVY